MGNWCSVQGGNIKPKETPLEFMDVFKRVEDGQTFRVKSNMKDNASPSFSTINFGQATAERWELE